MTNPLIIRAIGWNVARILLGIIFVYASVYKIINPEVFARQIFNYKLLPVWAINPAAIVLPWLQLLAGAALIVNRWSGGAALWIVGMMAVFQAALASALVRGLNVSCGCFEAGGAPATWATFGRDSLIFILALVVAFRAMRDNRRVRTRRTGLWMDETRL